MRLLPEWLAHYQKTKLPGDLTAGLIVTVMLIPQSLAYAMLAGLPPEIGLYASVLPLVAYALLGSSMTLAVGPVAVASLMTASALQPLAQPGSEQYVVLAATLAFLSGIMLLAFGLLRLGFLANFLSHPVISGFISGSAILITVSQLKHLFGLTTNAGNVFQEVYQLLALLPQANPATTALGLGTLIFLFFARTYLSGVLQKIGLKQKTASLISRLAPMVAVIVSIITVAQWDLAAEAGVAIVGEVPAGLPSLNVLVPNMNHLAALWLPALLISLVGFVESVSVAQSLALKRQERIQPNRELLGLGAANMASALSGGYPVTGGFARSVVNFAAGANTPLAGVISAVLMAIVIASLTGLFHHLPQAVLSATIIIAVTALVDFSTFKAAWQYDRADALSLVVTLIGVLLLGVEAGVLIGVALSLAVLVWRSSRPHIAIVGRVPGTEHFRNVRRHKVDTLPNLLALRVDESLFFANASLVQSHIERCVAANPKVEYVLLLCPAVNQIDSTALEALTQLQESLSAKGIQFMLAEVKGPVMDRLHETHLGRALEGLIFLSAHDAFKFVEERNLDSLAFSR
ncbi:SulP family inorganic anion transporter [Neopusillimonas maritima]|uniref:Sodium-independent anion transporter n=1 Tax=Neopusillimonas maritima TaxID=2026239 RepID=A0ABX9MW22_9BURK|nr:sulfate permease [Neopusillimonas maritima]RII83079.1 sodium-independent anion transporter [Neopusillimonas maritima]